MKRFKLLSAVFAIFAAISLTSCSDEDPSMLDIGDGGTGDGTMNVSINFKIDGEVQVFSATTASASVTNGTITIEALNEDTDETLTMTFTGNQLNIPYNASSMVYNDGNGNEYEAINPQNGEPSGIAKLSGVDTAASKISGYFSFIGSTGTDSEPIAFYSGTFNNVVYSGSLPNPTPNPTTGQYIKAKVDGEMNNWDTVTSQTVGEGVTFNGINMTSMSIMQISFPDASAIVADAVIPIAGEVGSPVAMVSLNMVAFTAVDGSITITSVTNGMVKGTYHFSATNTEETQTIQVTEGEFNVQM